MIVIPAIDLKGGKCVRLRQGLANEATEYSDAPADMARHWEEEGGKFLHVVDLDGAFEGRPAHMRELAAICAAIRIPVEFGGGLRTDADIAAVLAAGACRAILGTRACEHPDELARIVARFGGDRIAVGIDARSGLVQTKGWVETTQVRAVDLARQCEAAGIGTIICTDTARDGMMRGVNAAEMANICDAVACDVVASGGVSTLDDMRRLVELRRPNLVGAIVGKALYEKAVSIAQLEAAAP